MIHQDNDNNLKHLKNAAVVRSLPPGTRALCCALGLAFAAAPLPMAWAAAPSSKTGNASGPNNHSSNADQPDKVDKTAQVTVNFVNAEIDAVARAMGAILNKQFVVDPRVKGTVTVYSETPLTPREAYLNFLAALRGAGVAVVESGGMLKILPEADAKIQTGTVTVSGGRVQGTERAGSSSNDQIMTQIFRLQHESANNLVPVLRPLISPNNTINASASNNTLIITDYASNLQRLDKIIASMDVPAATDLEIIPVRYAIAADLAPIVQKLADAQGSNASPLPGVPSGSSSGGGNTIVMADTRTNTLLVRAPNPAKLSIIKQVVSKLDAPGQNGMGGSNIHVVYLKYAEAVKLAPLLRASYVTGDAAKNGAGANASSSGSTSQNSSSSSRQSSSSSYGGGSYGGGSGQGGAGGGGLSAQAASPVEQSGAVQTGGFVQADPATNSLIITAPEPMYRQLRTVIDQLDSRRSQVYVEALIVEVNAEKAADIGIQWQTILGQKGDGTIYGAGTNFGGGTSNIVNLTGIAGSGNGRANLATALTASAVPNGFNFGLVKKIGDIYTVGALAKFLQTNADGNVLSTPNILTLDNEEAKIVVGKNVPFTTGQYTNTGAGNGVANPFQTIDYRDVGLTLRIKPQIGENGTVRLTIFQESSNVLSTDASGPTTSKRTIESQVIVDDGAMLSIGGLMEDSYQGNASKVPGLGDVPVLGGLFRSENRNRRKTNLMVFLRPKIVRGPEDTNKVSVDRYDMIRATQQKEQPAPRVLMPINEAPILPPLPTASSAEAISRVSPPITDAAAAASTESDRTAAPTPTPTPTP